MYASLFSYEPTERKKMLSYVINFDAIDQYCQSGGLPKNSR